MLGCFFLVDSRMSAEAEAPVILDDCCGTADEDENGEDVGEDVHDMVMLPDARNIATR